MEVVDALIATFTEDFGRAVAHGTRERAPALLTASVRACLHLFTSALTRSLSSCRCRAVRVEVGRERDAALAIVDAAREDVEQARRGAAQAAAAAALPPHTRRT
jgi:hypothetical protein